MRFNQNKCINCGGSVKEATGVLIEVPSEGTKTNPPIWKQYHDEEL